MRLTNVWRIVDCAESILRRLSRAREGNVALLFGLAAIPVVIGAGIAMDTARVYMVKTRLGAALDAAALAVGSQSNQTSTTLTTDLQNYFFNNYCKKVPTGTSVTSCSGTVANENSISVQATTDISGATVTYRASATVPTTFMQLVGINSLPVSVVSQTTKFPGMEVALVLDNTGSMLCGGSATQASGYSGCSTGVVSADTTCTNSSNQSRICTLIPAAKQFITTLQAAITGPQSIYISIVPYVTTVNVGSRLCTSSTSCSHILTDATSGNFLDHRGNMLPVVPIQGDLSATSQTVLNVKYANGNPSTAPATAYTSGSTAIRAGMYVYGPGIPLSTTTPWIVSSVSGTSMVICPTSSLSSTSCSSTTTYPSLTKTGVSLAVGPPPANSSQTPQVGVNGLAALSLKATWSTGTKNISSIVTSPTSLGLTRTGMYVAGCNSATLNTSCNLFGNTSSSFAAVASSPAATGTTFTYTNGSTPTLAETATILYASPIRGLVTSGSTSVTGLTVASTTPATTDCSGGTLTAADIVPGMVVTGPGIAANTYVASVGAGTPPTTLTLSQAASTGAFGTTIPQPLMFASQGGNTTASSTTISCVTLTSAPAVGSIIVGNGIPPNTTVTATSGSFASNAATGTITISQAATATNNTELNVFMPLTFDSTFNTASPTGSSQSTSWGGCVIEPTSSGENTGSSVLNNSTANPDQTEPASSTTWFPFYWHRDTTNNWTTASGGVARQDITTETQGSLSSYDALDGPNQGCPAPVLPLTDLTTSAGQTAINTAINNMWPRVAGGTQVHTGMIWGWRALAPNGPFTANNGHPLDYTTASTQGWKKIIVLMTDGSEEWPTANEVTGFGHISDGKMGTTTYTAAAANLDSRLSTLCTNLKASAGNYTIYTIGLGTDGASNTQLQNCASQSSYFYSATPSNLSTVFTSIANSIIHLRLTM